MRLGLKGNLQFVCENCPVAAYCDRRGSSPYTVKTEEHWCSVAQGYLLGAEDHRVPVSAAAEDSPTYQRCVQKGLDPQRTYVTIVGIPRPPTAAEIEESPGVEAAIEAHSIMHPELPEVLQRREQLISAARLVNDAAHLSASVGLGKKDFVVQASMAYQFHSNLLKQQREQSKLVS